MTHRCFAPTGCTSLGEWQIQPLWLVLQKAFPGSSNCKWIAFIYNMSHWRCMCMWACVSGCGKEWSTRKWSKMVVSIEVYSVLNFQKNPFPYPFPHQCSMIFPRCTAPSSGVLCWSLNRPQEPLKTKPLLRKAGLRSDPRCTLGELCARPSSEGAAKLEKRGKENGRHFLIDTCMYWNYTKEVIIIGKLLRSHHFQ